MLVLTRREGESIHIGDNIIVTVIGQSHGRYPKRIRIGITAPADVAINREECLGRYPKAGGDHESRPQ